MATGEAQLTAAGDPATESIIEEALRNLWAVANELSRIRPARPTAYRVALFGSARVEPGEPLYEDVKRLAVELAALGCDIVTGGGPGLMQAANEGATIGDPDDRVRSIGVRIALPFEQGANPFVEKLYAHRTFFTRLHQFVRLSNAFVVVGGGIGTLLETLMVWQLLQVGHIRDVPLVFVGPMWKELVAWGREHMAERPGRAFANAEDFDIPRCVATVDEVLPLLRPGIEHFQAAGGGRCPSEEHGA